MKKTSILTIPISILVALVILTGSISVPILVRGLYYNQIEKLGIPESTGLSVETIREAFDEMMDYCVGGGEGSGVEFGTGSLAWSEEGKAHFDDVAKLFVLDLRLFLISGVLLVLFFELMLIIRNQKIGGKDVRLGRGNETQITLYPTMLGRGPFFWGPVIMVVGFAVIGASIAANFDAFFVKFHQLFFPGKSNWIFDPAKDEIINILPETLFRNFAILIVALVLGLSIVAILVDFALTRKR